MLKITPVIGIWACLLFATATRAEPIVISGLAVPPYSIEQGSSPPKGLMIDAITEALTSIGLEPEFRFSTWSRAYNNAKQGNVDALIPTIKSEDRQEYLAYPETPLTELEMRLFVRKGAVIDFDGTMESLADLTIGRIQRGRVAPALDAAFASGQIDSAERPNFTLLVRGLVAGRMDAVAGDHLMVNWGASQSNLSDRIEAVDPVLDRVPVYLAISRKSKFSAPEALAAINAAITEVRATQDKHGGLRTAAPVGNVAQR